MLRSATGWSGSTTKFWQWPDLYVVSALSVGAAFLISLLSPIALIPRLRRRGVIDKPNHRSSHSDPTVRGVGIAPAAGAFAAMTVLAIGGTTPPAVVVLAIGLAMSGLGLAEDIRGLPVLTRLLMQVLLGGLLAVALWSGAGPSLLWIPVGALVVAGYVNAVNFMDGVNGMSALHGVVAGTYFALVGWLENRPDHITVALVLAVIYAAFLPWNLRKPGAFLGDVGSYLLGSLVVGLVLWSIMSQVPVLVAIAPALPYLLDVSSTLVRRLSRRANVFSAHREHIYQLLTQRGFSHLSSAAVVASFSVGCCALALISWAHPGLTVACWAGVITLMAVYVLLPRSAARLRDKIGTV